LDGGLETDWHASVNIRAVIAEAIEQIRPQAVKKEIQIVNIDNLGAPADEVLIPGNLIQLQRAIINILTNGVNYTAMKGSITVAARMADGDRLAIRVADNGQGIDADDLPHIFERFYRADKSRTRTSGGTGLGLAITREIIARHHGTIEVESTVGKGSTFTITLPSRTGRITK
jgi:two-component system sensor histidine kinase BaeS